VGVDGTSAQVEALKKAADVLARADALLIGAGAGMGVDSGLPDFRGPKGFWAAYPPYQKLGLDFVALANPRWFTADPALAWGFYEHRLELYRSTPPHAGFARLKKWAERKAHGAAVFTSNVDGHFQRAGFAEDQLYECHGSLNWLQCTRFCGQDIFSAQGVNVAIDTNTMRAQAPLPACPKCGALARPNILMFNDSDWEAERNSAQGQRLDVWLANVDPEMLAIVECGAGTAIPSVRHFCEGLANLRGATLIRINPREPDVPPGQISIQLGAKEALEKIDAFLKV